MRDGFRRLRARLWGAVAVGVAISLSPRVGVPFGPPARPAAPARTGRSASPAPDQAAASAALIRAAVSRPGKPAATHQIRAADIAAVLGPGGSNLTGHHGNPVTQARTVIQYLGQTEASAAQEAGVFLPSGPRGRGRQGPRPDQGVSAQGGSARLSVPVAAADPPGPADRTADRAASRPAAGRPARRRAKDRCRLPLLPRSGGCQGLPPPSRWTRPG